MNTTTTTTAAELRTAATRLRCDHSFPIQPPHGSLANPGPCKHCGTPYRASGAVADHLREPIAELLDDVANEAERHEAHGMGNSQDEIATGPILAIARAINGGIA